MFSWFKKNLTNVGSVLFPGPLPPRPEELDGLAAHDVEARSKAPGAGHHWKLELRHPSWGAAEVSCPRDSVLPPRQLLDWDPRLSKREKEQAAGYGSHIVVRAEPQAQDVLRDRKVLLRFLNALLGSQGLMTMDHVAQAYWSRDALQNELRHDAALDISALFTMHLVTGAQQEVFWLHSHGLKEIGFCDFDVIEPHPSCHSTGYDALRALAFAIVEGKVTADGETFDLVQPGGTIRLLSAKRVLAEPAEARERRWRESVDEEHLDGHAVVCDPGGASWFGLVRRKTRPSRFFSAEFPDEGVIAFSNDASALMSERARNTYPTFQALLEDLAEYSLPAMVKLGYVVDGGGENDREHLWFEVHACRAGEIEGTLVNQPFHIERMKPGERAAHPIDLISDWRILSPFGSITPSFDMALREIRSRPDELRKVLAEAESGPS